MADKKFERRFLATARAGFSLERRQRAGKEKQVFIGYAAVFFNASDPGTQYQLYPGLCERVLPGAFDRALRERQDICGLLNHEPDNLLGRCSSGTMRVSVDKRGLRYEIDYDPDDADHQRVMAKMKRGDLTGSSFSFRIAPGGQKFVTGKGASDVRELLDVDVLDVGPVSFPAYASTSADARAGKRSVLLVPAEEICAEWRKARAAMGLGDAPIRLGLQQMREQLMRVERQQMLDRLRSIEASIRRPAGRERRATDLEFSYEACSTD